MTQLAGLPCVICNRSVDSIVEGRFCVGCGGAVHKDCVNPPADQTDGMCPDCGADLQQVAAAVETKLRRAPPRPPVGPPALTINGIGTFYCFARGSGGRGGDALQCFVLFFMPLAPFKAVHLFNEQAGFMGSSYRAIPLRWSSALVRRVFLLYWMAFPCAIGGVTALLATLLGLANDFRGPYGYFVVGGLVPALACGLGYYLLWQTDRRTREIRRLLGRHEYGNSDPVMWTEELLAGVRTPQVMFGEESFAAAVPLHLERGDRTTAMWAARLSAALEDPAKGEALTDAVLNDQTSQHNEVGPT